MTALLLLAAATTLSASLGALVGLWAARTDTHDQQQLADDNAALQDQLVDLHHSNQALRSDLTRHLEQMWRS